MPTPILFTVVMPMTMDQFKSAESQFIAAVASAAGCNQSWVRIVDVRESTQDRRQARSILIDTAIDIPPASQRGSQGASVSGSLPVLTLSSLDSSLQQQGLPASLGIQFSTPQDYLTTADQVRNATQIKEVNASGVPPAASVPAAGVSQAGIIGGSIGALVGGLGILTLAAIKVRRRRAKGAAVLASIPESQTAAPNGAPVSESQCDIVTVWT
jgi:hypothetical protein